MPVASGSTGTSGTTGTTGDVQFTFLRESNPCLLPFLFIFNRNIQFLACNGKALFITGFITFVARCISPPKVKAAFCLC